MNKLRVGIVGTGYVAKTRGQIFRDDPRCELVAMAGSLDRVRALTEPWGITGYTYWSELVSSNSVDAVVVCNSNREHGAVVRQALNLGKPTIVDYPLALNYQEALELVNLAKHKSTTLHLEQIELLGGVHRQVRNWLPKVGQPQFVRYATQTPQRPAPDRWVYQPAQLGFPLTAAVSRIHRLIDLLGTVKRVSSQVRYTGPNLPQTFSSCFCHALLEFSNFCVGEVGYHKGEQIWQSERILEVHGETGGIFFRGDWGKLVTNDGEQEVQTETAKGLFLKDTHYFLGHLLEGKPNYTDQQKVLQAIATANACEVSAQNQRWVAVQEIAEKSP